MIISAPYRSGGTSLAIKLAKDNNLIFAGQIDNNSVIATRIEDKNKVHEYDNQPDHSINDIVSMLIDDSKHVILNNSSPALFPRSSYFIIRKDMSRVYTSMYWLMSKFYPAMSMWTVDMMFTRLTFYNAMLLGYIKQTNITPLVLEEQEWYTPTIEHTVPKEVLDLVNQKIEYLKEFQ